MYLRIDVYHVHIITCETLMLQLNDLGEREHSWMKPAQLDRAVHVEKGEEV